MSKFLLPALALVLCGCGGVNTKHNNANNQPSAQIQDTDTRAPHDAVVHKEMSESTAVVTKDGKTEQQPQTEKTPTTAKPVAPVSATDDATSSVVLTVHFNGYRTEEGGQMCISLFDKPEHFPETAGSIFNTCKALSTLAEGIVIPNLKMGQQYAIAAFHDKNMNKVMETKKLLGHDVPAEGFGFSSNPGLTRLGPPLFSEAAVTLDKAESSIDITINYLF